MTQYAIDIGDEELTTIEAANLLRSEPWAHGDQRRDAFKTLLIDKDTDNLLAVISNADAASAVRDAAEQRGEQFEAQGWGYRLADTTWVELCLIRLSKGFSDDGMVLLRPIARWQVGTGIETELLRNQLQEALDEEKE